MQKIKNIQRGDHIYEVYATPANAKEVVRLIELYDTITNDIDALELDEIKQLRELIKQQTNIIKQIKNLGKIQKK